MVIMKDTLKKTAKDGERSRPTARRAGKVSPALPAGGVCGKARLSTPSSTEKPAANNSGRLVSAAGRPSTFGSAKSTSRLAAIQPIVPNTRIDGKSRAPSGTCVKVMELDSTSVGE